MIASVPARKFPNWLHLHSNFKKQNLWVICWYLRSRLLLTVTNPNTPLSTQQHPVPRAGKVHPWRQNSRSTATCQLDPVCNCWQTRFTLSIYFKNVWFCRAPSNFRKGTTRSEQRKQRNASACVKVCRSDIKGPSAQLVWHAAHLAQKKLPRTKSSTAGKSNRVIR